MSKSSLSGSNMVTGHLEVRKTARYYHRKGGQQPRYILLAIHGYGQSAASFMEDVLKACDANLEIVAPEGLSRFYWKGFEGPVVASWMTKEDRLVEIEDHCAYLEDLIAFVKRDHPNLPLRVLGFSQGVATACRWLAQSKWEVKQLLLWAGTVPEEEYLYALSMKGINAIHLIVGNQDLWLPKDKIELMKERIDNSGLKTTFHAFDGGHQLETKLLSQLLRD